MLLKFLGLTPFTLILKSRQRYVVFSMFSYIHILSVLLISIAMVVGISSVVLACMS